MSDVASGLSFTTSAGGAAILDAQHNRIVTLNATASFTWEHLQRGEPTAEITRELSFVTGMDHRVVKDDVEAFLQQLVDHRLFQR